MAKKYLLYIHNPRFDKEEKKSGLVNKLLESYYKPSPYDDMPVTAVFNKPPKKVGKPASSLCPHGQPWMTCKVSSCGIKGRNMGLT